jgi:hypothetical protein
LSPPGDFRPPLPIPLTTSGGSEYHLPQKTAFPQFSKPPIFCLFDTSFFRSKLWEKTDFKKPREVFVQHMAEGKKPLHIFAKVPPVGRIEAVFQPHFSDFWFFCYSPDFAGAVTVSWRKIWQNQRRFLSSTCPYTIKSFSFFPGVSIEEKQMSVRTPFLQKFDPSFMADSSGFLGICCYFWPRRLNPTSKNLLGDLSYLLM